MKSTRHAGNVKMRGKKHKMFSCGCCDCVDFRSDYFKKIAEKEIKEEIARIGIESQQ